MIRRRTRRGPLAFGLPKFWGFPERRVSHGLRDTPGKAGWLRESIVTGDEGVRNRVYGALPWIATVTVDKRDGVERYFSSSGLGSSAAGAG